MPVMMENARPRKRRTRVDEKARPNPRELTPTARVKQLSPAEREVVQAMVEGLSPKEVAVKRGTSIATVRTQLKRAKKKAAARTLNELVALVCMADMQEAADNGNGRLDNGNGGLDHGGPAGTPTAWGLPQLATTPAGSSPTRNYDAERPGGRTALTSRSVIPSLHRPQPGRCAEVAQLCFRYIWYPPYSGLVPC